MRYCIALLVGIAALIGCHRSPHDETTYVRGLALPKPPKPQPTWPNYRVVDYLKLRGHPVLTPIEFHMIRGALRLVKPCQRAILRYAFPDGGADHMVLFFYAPPGGWAHVLWSRNLFYKTEDGTEFAGSATYPIPPHFSEITYDLQHTDCHGAAIQDA